nr:glycosyltransferase [Lewinella sp. JB7]
MAVHNEAAVLPEKLRSLADTDYAGPLQFHFRSDQSTDATDDLLRQFARSFPDQTFVTRNDLRTGKPASVNQIIASLPPTGVYVLTDASVFLTPTAVTELVRPMLADENIGVVDSRMVHTGLRDSGVSRLEDRYIGREVGIKQAESCLWQTMIGPFGGCWAIRAEAYRPVPPAFLVDDFYLCMAAYEAGWLGVASDRAVVYEGVGQRLSDEFRRKRRIGAGNWQNLLRFRRLWWPPLRDPLAFAFFSHKVLRWLTPQLLLVGAVAWLGVILLTGNYWATALFVVVCAACVLAVIVDPLLHVLGIHSSRVRALRYFLAMNLALLLGFFRFLNGIHSNVWQPSHRNQDPGGR